MGNQVSKNEVRIVIYEKSKNVPNVIYIFSFEIIWAQIDPNLLK